MSRMNGWHFWVALSLLLLISEPRSAYGQAKFLGQYSLSSAVSVHSSLPPSNGVSLLTLQDSNIIWIGTSKGAARSIDFGASWESYKSDPAFSNLGIFSLTTLHDTIWASTGFEKEITDGTVQTGTGYAFSTNGGAQWQHVNQTKDARGDSIISYGVNDSIWILPVVVPEQNVTFDIALSPGAVWIASWASGLRKSTNNGTTWERILLPADNRSSLDPTDTLWTYRPTDTLKQHRIYDRFDPRRNNNFLAFGVHTNDGNTIWCGTAGGVNKSTDGGISWKRFTHQNEALPILGNWVIAIDEQPLPGHTRVWTTNWVAQDPSEEYGVSYTDDGGLSWKNLLQGVKAYAFAFKDSVAYIVSDQGIFRTPDGGLSFSHVSTITDPASHQAILGASMFSVAVIEDTVFVGTGDGIATTIDNAQNSFGARWNVRRAYQQVGATGTAYAYPNPFAPNLEQVRIHYATGLAGACLSCSPDVSIEIFDFGMNRLRSLINHATRSGGEFDEIWDGRDDQGRTVANGVYFFRIKTDTGDPEFGKILVLQ
jgi:hypothetical protein